MTRPPPNSPLFPYTPLSRSHPRGAAAQLADRLSSAEEQLRHHRQFYFLNPQPFIGSVAILGDAAVTLNLGDGPDLTQRDRKSTRLNSSHSQISYAVFCLKKR